MMNIDEDLLDSCDFDPIDYINKRFPTGGDIAIDLMHFLDNIN